MFRALTDNLAKDYAGLHERQTTMDFHHQPKGAMIDTVDEGLVLSCCPYRRTDSV
jgi:hypothetical protein